MATSMSNAVRFARLTGGPETNERLVLAIWEAVERTDPDYAASLVAQWDKDRESNGVSRFKLPRYPVVMKNFNSDETLKLLRKLANSSRIDACVKFLPMASQPEVGGGPGKAYTTKDINMLRVPDRAAANNFFSEAIRVDEKEARRLVDGALRYVYSNGSFQTFVKTMEKANELYVPMKAFNPEEIDLYVRCSRAYLPTKTDYSLFDWESALRSALGFNGGYSLNMRSAAGTTDPRAGSITPEILAEGAKQARAVMREFFTANESGSLAMMGKAMDDVMDDPLITTFMLKFKKELTTLEKYSEKVRAYSVTPVAFRLLAGPLMYWWKHEVMERFVDSPSSSLLFGWSWAGDNPGALILDERIKALSNGQSFFANFGDDMYFVFRMLDGNLGFFAPDIKAMDYTTKFSWARVASQRLIDDMIDHVAEGQSGVYLIPQLLRRTHIDATMVSQHGTCFARQGGLATGGVACTDFEIIALNAFLGDLARQRFKCEPEDLQGRTIFSDIKYADHARGVMNKFVAMAKSVGWTVKEETKVLAFFTDTEWNSSDMKLDLPLLGVTMRREGLRLRPEPDYTRLLAGLFIDRSEWVLPGSMKRWANAAKACRKLICIQASLVQGGCFNPTFYEGAKKLYAVTKVALDQKIAADGTEILELLPEWQNAGHLDPQMDMLGYDDEEGADVLKTFLSTILTVEDGQVVIKPIMESSFYAQYYLPISKDEKKSSFSRVRPEPVEEPLEVKTRLTWGDMDDEPDPFVPPKRVLPEAKKDPRKQKNQPARAKPGLAPDPVAQEKQAMKRQTYADRKNASMKEGKLGKGKRKTKGRGQKGEQDFQEFETGSVQSWDSEVSKPSSTNSAYEAALEFADQEDLSTKLTGKAFVARVNRRRFNG